MWILRVVIIILFVLALIGSILQINDNTKEMNKFMNETDIKLNHYSKIISELQHTVQELQPKSKK